MSRSAESHEVVETLSFAFDYNSMFQTFVQDIGPSAERLLRMVYQSESAELRYDLRYAINALLANIAMAANCATSVDQINELRRVCTDANSYANEEFRKGTEWEPDYDT